MLVVLFNWCLCFHLSGYVWIYQGNGSNWPVLQRWDVPWQWQTVSLTSLACGLRCLSYCLRLGFGLSSKFSKELYWDRFRPEYLSKLDIRCIFQGKVEKVIVIEEANSTIWIIFTIVFGNDLICVSSEELVANELVARWLFLCDFH